MTQEIMTHPKSESKPWLAQGIFLLIVSLYCFFYRLFPEFTSPNLAPIGGLALCAGFILSWRWGWLVPLAVMATSDLVLWTWKGYTPFNLSVYSLFVLYSIAGGTLKDSLSMGKWLSRVLASSLLFFLVTNAQIFLTASFPADQHPGVLALETPTDLYSYPLLTYSRSWGGLAVCYLYALPFYARTLAGDILFSGLFLGLSLLVRKYAVTSPKFAREQDCRLESN